MFTGHSLDRKTAWPQHMLNQRSCNRKENILEAINPPDFALQIGTNFNNPTLVDYKQHRQRFCLEDPRQKKRLFYTFSNTRVSRILRGGACQTNNMILLGFTCNGAFGTLSHANGGLSRNCPKKCPIHGFRLWGKQNADSVFVPIGLSVPARPAKSRQKNSYASVV